MARRMFEVTILQMKAFMEVLKPGREIGDVFEAYARVADENGFRDQRFNSCGYSLGATFAPTWIDFPISIGQTVEVIKDGCISLFKLPFCFTRKQTIVARRNVCKEDNGFTAEEEDEGENIQDVEFSDGEDDAEDHNVEYDFSDYKSAATFGDPTQRS
ncbi:hypothetical protein PAAG_11120 [Paracoccidioides lutzii Pb01]|uniref:Uncharacterized protein n=1 Tax=Paracoccidioides lutzii (strain ATCC MYA-826 / Pb01) TaxID=502779 RepID=A0A0A2V7Y3_PARBA|nr:hypothetical protein PAAG_11120 [Paracoccidioides lutzii Pb01]KGQ02165.1 hypothetical protein PAAG_11120 [Paracoccidioides lutzii Pb01]